jgi:hypothetical protein
MSGCWIWTASIANRGYPQFKNGEGRVERGNVVSYRLHNGPIPKGLLVRHTCDCRWCVNPEHLILGSYQDNVDDAVQRDRHTRGERHASARLSENDARVIRDDKRSNAELAAVFGIGQRMVQMIKARKRWAHLS